MTKRVARGFATCAAPRMPAAQSDTQCEHVTSSPTARVRPSPFGCTAAGPSRERAAQEDGDAVFGDDLPDLRAGDAEGDDVRDRRWPVTVLAPGARRRGEQARPEEARERRVRRLGCHQKSTTSPSCATATPSGAGSSTGRWVSRIRPSAAASASVAERWPRGRAVVDAVGERRLAEEQVGAARQLGELAPSGRSRPSTRASSRCA